MIRRKIRLTSGCEELDLAKIKKRVKQKSCQTTMMMTLSQKLQQYLAVLVSQLWGLLAGERTRVSHHPLFQSSGLICGCFQGDCLEQEQSQMKKDLAEVKAYTEAMAESNRAQDAYVDKEQDKFFC